MEEKERRRKKKNTKDTTDEMVISPNSHKFTAVIHSQINIFCHITNSKTSNHVDLTWKCLHIVLFSNIFLRYYFLQPIQIFGIHIFFFVSIEISQTEILVKRRINSSFCSNYKIFILQNLAIYINWGQKNGWISALL